MRLADVDQAAVQAALAAMRARFETKDVSEHAAVARAHSAVRHERNFHAVIGSFLSRNRTELGIALEGWLPSRGAIWVKNLPLSRRPSRRQAVADSPDRLDVGPQHRGDTPFTARMRLHQSWYRSSVLQVPYGTGPGPKDAQPLGSMLSREAAAAGMNFLSPSIFDVVRRRIELGPGVEPYRCRHNLLSSQPMCFNLFGPLVDDRELATALFRALLPDVVETVEDVRIEHAPKPIKEYLGDGTSFDAFVEYRRHDGARAFIGIETKLTEPFSPGTYDRARYRELSEQPDSPWRAGAGPLLADSRWNQLWRNQLLAQALLTHAKSDYQGGSIMVLRHPQDDQCAEAIQGYRRLLARPETFHAVSLDHLIRTWTPNVRDGATDEWLKAFAVRYVDLTASQHLVAAEKSRSARPSSSMIGQGSNGSNVSP